MKKLSLLLAVFLLAACGSNTETLKGTGQSEASADTGDYATAEVTLTDGKVTEVKLDETSGGKSKKELGSAYNMVIKSSIQKEFYEQMEGLEKVIAEKGTEVLTLDEEGKPTNEDVKAVCTVSLTNIKTALENAIADANASKEAK